VTTGVSRIEDFIWRRIGDEIVVITEDGLSLHVLNKTAAYIWELCDGKNDLDEIVRSICERFEVSAEDARADVNDVMNQLEGLGLIKLTEVA
jgi:hypothetical protein